MNEAFEEKDEKYREWTTQETQEKKVVKAMMVPLVVSHDVAVHKDSVKRWKNFAPDIQVDLVRIVQSVLRFNVAIVGRVSTRAAGSPKCGEERSRKQQPRKLKVILKEYLEPNGNDEP